MPKITPFLWFDTQAEEAAQFYTSVFPNSQVLEVARYGEGGPGQAGSVMSVRFALDGNEFVALNGGVPLSVTTVVMTLVPSPCGSVSEMVIIPFVSMDAHGGGFNNW